MAYDKEVKEKAIELRKKGMSIIDICNEMQIAKGTIYYWVRNVELTNEQKKYLKSGRKTGQAKASRAMKKKALLAREKYQEEGRKKARENEIDHCIGCMLYWGEGTKSRSSCQMTNSDVNIHKNFMKFLRKYFKIKKNKLSIRINAYLDHGLSVDDIHDYWIKELNIDGCRIHKAVIRNPEKSSFNNKRKKSKLKYGVLTVCICDVGITQHIYGAIQEYGDFEMDKWIN